MLAIGREQNWPLPAAFPAQADPEQATPLHRISYQQAREVCVQAQHKAGKQLSIWSAARKALPQLSHLAAGMSAQPTLGQALQFGLRYQLIAGALTHLQLDTSTPQPALVAQAMFDDAELENFLAVDHLATALNAARQLCGGQLVLRGVELCWQDAAHRSVYEAFFACPVVFGAETNRLLLAAEDLQLTLARPDRAQAERVARMCVAELADAGVSGRQTLLRQLIGMRCETLSIGAAAAVLQTSPRSLHRWLARDGISYSELTERLRTERARQLLQSGVSLERIAEQLNYSDSRSFRRAFQRRTAMTPTAYRQSLGSAG